MPMELLDVVVDQGIKVKQMLVRVNYKNKDIDYFDSDKDVLQCFLI